MILRPLLREMETAANGCDEACFVVHVEAVVRKAAGRAWATLDSNDDGQLDLEELRITILDFNSLKKIFRHENTLNEPGGAVNSGAEAPEER